MTAVELRHERSRRRGRAAILLTTAFVIAGALPVTVAQFSAGFGTAATASGRVDLAQTETGEAGQYPSADDAQTLAGNGSTINALDARTTGWPTLETASVDVPLFNREGVDTATRLILGVENEGLLSYLRFGASIDGEPVGNAPVPGSWFTEYPDGLDLTTIPAHDEATLTLSVWLAPDAPVEVLNTNCDITVQVVGESLAGDAPVLLEGIWR